MKIISIKVQPEMLGTLSKITQKIPSVAKLETNMPTELIMKSARYCIRPLTYWASMRKYRRIYSLSVRKFSLRRSATL